MPSRLERSPDFDAWAELARRDAERWRYKHPLKSCLAIYSMMWDSVYGQHGLLQALNGLLKAEADAGMTGATGARILPMRRPGHWTSRPLLPATMDDWRPNRSQWFVRDVGVLACPAGHQHSARVAMIHFW